MKEKKGKRTYHLNKWDHKLYYLDSNSGKRILATKYEKEQYEQNLKKELQKDIRLLLGKIGFIGFCFYLFYPYKNNFSKWDESRLKLENVFDVNGEMGFVKNEIMLYIEENKKSDKDDYEIIYQYFFENYGHQINSSDIRKIINLISQDVCSILNQDSLIKDCFSSLISAEVNHDYCGNIRLSIICDILGQEETIYLLLTNQEQLVYEKLKEKLNIPEEQYTFFLEDLNKLNDISNGKKVANYNFHAITETIISKYSTILIEKNLLLKMFKEQNGQEFVPIGSFLTRVKSDYPLQIHNEFIEETKLIVNRNLFQIEDLPSIAETKMKNTIQDIDEDLTIIIGYLPSCPEALRYGLQNHDRKSIQIYLNEYVKYLMNKDFSLKEICEVNDIFKYLRKEKIERAITIKFESQINYICILQRKKYFANLINKESVGFIRLGGNNKTELPTTIYYPCYETKENQESKAVTWYVKIPKSDQDIIPAVIIQNEFNQVYTISWDSLLDGARIIENEDFLIYEIKGFENSQLIISISINNYLTTKKENFARRKEKKYN